MFIKLYLKIKLVLMYGMKEINPDNFRINFNF